MSLKKVLLAGAALAAVSAVPAQASIIDNPHFKVLGLVIVWGADQAGNAPIASDFIIDNDAGNNDADLISTDVYTVVTGSLTPTPDSIANGEGSIFDVTGETSGGVFTDNGSAGILDAADALTAFGLDASTDVALSGAYQSSFFVASNTAFAIDAAVSSTGTFALTDIGYDLDVTASGTAGALNFGGSADPSLGGNIITGSDLDTINGTQVYLAPDKTALNTGSIVDQSIRFDASYSLDYDLSMGAGDIEAEVVYTVYVP